MTVGKGVRKQTHPYILLVGSSFLEVSLAEQISYLGLNHVVGTSDQFNI